MDNNHGPKDLIVVRNSEDDRLNRFLGAVTSTVPYCALFGGPGTESWFSLVICFFWGVGPTFVTWRFLESFCPFPFSRSFSVFIPVPPPSLPLLDFLAVGLVWSFVWVFAIQSNLLSELRTVRDMAMDHHAVRGQLAQSDHVGARRP